MFVLPNLCLSCANFIGGPPEEKVCNAFPEGIPADVWLGYTSHWEPFEDKSDQEIAYEALEDAEDTLLAYIAFWYEPADPEGDTPADYELEPYPG
jgi:hypothetical protein